MLVYLLMAFAFAGTRGQQGLEAHPTNNGSFCHDSQGVLLQAIPEQPSKFISVNMADPANPRRTVMDCAHWTSFSLETCECSIFGNATGIPANSTVYDNSTTSNNITNVPCLVYLPFNADLADHSINQLATEVTRGNISIDHTIMAHGAGSGYFSNGGRLEIPAMTNYDFQDHGSWCLFVRAASQGRVFSNGPNSTFAMTANEKAVNVILGLANGAKMDLSTPVSNTSFHQICAIFSNGTITFYVDNRLIITRIIPTGGLALTHNPFAIGSATFSGFIDEVLICRHAINAKQVDAHYRGDTAFMIKNGMIPDGAKSTQH